LLLGWATIRETAATSATFILVNSISGIGGLLQSGDQLNLPPMFLVWIPLVIVGGYLGSHYGSGKFNTVTLRRLLALVLLIAAAKLIDESVKQFRSVGQAAGLPRHQATLGFAPSIPAKTANHSAC
jgi:uncharacterized membrane protein YfcA